MGSSIDFRAYLDEAEQYGLLNDRNDERLRDHLFSHRQVLRNRIESKFYDVQFEGARVLDIGSGSGRYSLLAAREGAERVVALEPEVPDSRASRCHTLDRLAADYQTITVESDTFQEFDTRERTFDIILSHNSINHLDGEACRVLHESDWAIERYRAIFDKLSRLAADGATLFVADASRANFFSGLGLLNPFVPELDWDVHQPPQLWSRLLEDHGFVKREIRWIPILSLLYDSRTQLLENSLAAYLTNSHFVLLMDRQRTPDNTHATAEV